MEYHWKNLLATWGLVPIYIYIYNNELRYHCSINYITKIASVMMWELPLDEWEKTVLLNSWLDASFYGDVWWSRGYSISVDYCAATQVRVPTLRLQKVFSMIFHDKYCYLYNMYGCKISSYRYNSNECVVPH